MTPFQKYALLLPELTFNDMAPCTRCGARNDRPKARHCTACYNIEKNHRKRSARRAAKLSQPAP